MLTVLYLDQLYSDSSDQPGIVIWQKTSAFRNDYAFAKQRCQTLRDFLSRCYSKGSEAFHVFVILIEKLFWDFITPYNETCEDRGHEVKPRCLCDLHEPNSNPPTFKSSVYERKVTEELTRLLRLVGARSSISASDEALKRML